MRKDLGLHKGIFVILGEDTTVTHGFFCARMEKPQRLVYFNFSSFGACVYVLPGARTVYLDLNI